MQNDKHQIVTYCHSTVNIATVSYQTSYYFYYPEIHIKRYIIYYCTLIHIDYLILIIFILHYHGTLFSHKYRICGIFNSLCYNIFASVKEINKIWLRLTKNLQNTKFLLPQISNHWKIENYRGSNDCDKVDIDPDIKSLASDDLRQSTTVPIKCDIFPWTWTWCLLYFFSWYDFKKHPGIV